MTGQDAHGVNGQMPRFVTKLEGGDQLSTAVHLASGAVAHRTPVKSRAAADLGDLWSVISDLERVVQLCERLDVEQDNLVESALWEAAVIAYGRCFLTGKPSQGKGQRRKVPNEVTAARAPDLIEVHRKVMEQYRGRHVGHRAGSAEMVLVDALRETPDGPVVGVLTWAVRLMRPDDHPDLRRAAEDLLSRLRPLHDQEQQALISALNPS